MRLLIAFGLLALTILLSACASRGPLSSDPGRVSIAEQQRQAQLQQLRDWAFKARISIRLEDKGKTRGGSGDLHWRQYGERLEMNFHAALGRGAWQLVADPAGAVLRQADGQSFRAADVSELIARQLGWDVPVAALRCWLLAVTKGSRCGPELSRVSQRDTEGRPRLVQNGEWQVRYLDWHDRADFDLPRKLELTAPGRKFRLIVKDWQVEEKNPLRDGNIY